MELVTVGTGTVAPSASRTSACHWVSRGSLKILLDCGAGALHRLAQFGLPWHEVTHVIVSHFHPDHWGELPMLVYALKYTTVPPRTDPLVVLGPPGVVRLVKKLAEGYGPWLLRSEEHTSELQSLAYLVCRLLLEKKKKRQTLTSNDHCYSLL